MTSISLVAVFNEKNEVLLLKRKADVHCPDVWSFPGGKKEIGETSEDTAIRELKEETNIDVKVVKCIGEHNHQYDDRFLRFAMFAATLPQQSIIMAETDVVWCEALELRNVSMPKANQSLIGMLESYLLQKENPPARS